MMKKAVLLFCLISGFASADVITFDSNPDNLYWTSPVISDDFAFSDIAGNGSLGTASNLDGESVDNGTVHLMDWTNGGNVSFMRMNATDHSLFTLTAFDFTSGYLDGTNMAEVLFVRGFDTNGTMTGMQSFNASTFTFNAFTTLTLGDSFEDVSFVTFQALGTNNRLGYDNFVVNQAVSVSEPATLAILLAGVAGVSLRRRKIA